MATRKTKTTTKRSGGGTKKAEAAGAKYAADQLQSDHFQDYLFEQLFEGHEMAHRGEAVITDTRRIARNILQQLKYDIARDYEVPSNFRSNDNTARAFVEGIREELDRDEVTAWLVEEIEYIQQELDERDVEKGLAPDPRQQSLPGIHEASRGGNRGAPPPRRVRDYIAIDRHDRPVGPRHKSYSDAKREADNAGGVVKFVPSGAREAHRASQPDRVASAIEKWNNGEIWSGDVYGPLTDAGFIYRQGDVWVISPSGKRAGLKPS